MDRKRSVFLLLCICVLCAGKTLTTADTGECYQMAVTVASWKLCLAADRCQEQFDHRVEC